MKFLLIFILVVYLLGQLVKFVLKQFVTKAAQQGNFQNPYNQRQQPKKEGEVTVEGDKANKKFYDKNMGDYVDYEEAE